MFRSGKYQAGRSNQLRAPSQDDRISVYLVQYQTISIIVLPNKGSVYLANDAREEGTGTGTECSELTLVSKFLD